MRAFRKTVPAGALLGLFLVLGCDESTNPKSDPAVGTWKGTVKELTMVMNLKSDLSFTGDLPVQYTDFSGTFHLFGTYTVAGNAITLQYASSLLDAEGSPPPNPNPAVGTITGTSMKIPTPYGSEVDSTTLKKQ